MFLVLLFLMSSAAAQEPAMTIVVNGSKYQEVYVEDPRIICETPCSLEQDDSIIFIEANRKHRAWYRHGEISGVYNSETIQLIHDCDWKRNSLKCAKEHDVWVLRTTITQTKEKASINAMIFDSYGMMIGQGSISRGKKVTVVERQKRIQQQLPTQPVTTTSCQPGTNNCTTVPVTPQAPTINEVEDLEPSIIEALPIIRDRDVGQVMIHVYDSILE